MATLTALLLACAARTEAQRAATYTIAFAADGRSATVTASVPVRQGVLTIATGGGIDHLPSQWATFIRDLRATSASGVATVPQFNQPGGWIIPGMPTETVDLTYAVDLSYAHSPWPPGNEQAGLWSDNALYTITKPLFIAGAPSSALVTVVVPDGWRVTSPWERFADRRNTYRVQSVEDLIDNSIVVGLHSERMNRHVAPSVPYRFAWYASALLMTMSARPQRTVSRSNRS
jgi:hypothetical protein